MKTFQEKLYEHHSQVFTVDAVLYRGQTKFQEALVFENVLFGRVLVLDGIVQLTERDNHIYHEMIAHVPLLAHGTAKRVLIIGGGDGGTLKEVLKHRVENVVMVELDQEVIELSKRYFPQVSDGAFDDRRVNLVIGDGAEYVTQVDAQFDVVIIDSTDPVGPGEQLFTRAFYERCRTLLPPNGMIALQAGAAGLPVRSTLSDRSSHLFQPMRGECWLWSPPEKARKRFGPQSKHCKSGFRYCSRAPATIRRKFTELLSH